MPFFDSRRLQPDPILVKSAARGEADALDDLLRILWPHAYRASLAIIQDRSRAEDVAQDSLFLVSLHLTNLRDHERFVSWFFTIVTRCVLQTSKRETREMSLMEVTSVITDDDGASDRLDVEHALAALPMHLRAVVALKYYHGFSSREIAGIMRAPSPTIRFWLSQAKYRLRLALAFHDDTSAESCPYV